MGEPNVQVLGGRAILGSGCAPECSSLPFVERGGERERAHFGTLGILTWSEINIGLKSALIRRHLIRISELDFQNS